jgi:hypothetical protein
VNALPVNGTADAAKKLAFSRQIAGVPFDGTRDIRLSARDVGALPVNGTADAAKKLAFSRQIAGVSFDGTRDIRLSARDVNALPANGTAEAAKKLAFPRRISGVPFDGTSDITLPFINTTDMNVRLPGNGNIAGDLRAGRVLSKSNIVVGEGNSGGYAFINPAGNINGRQWGGWLSTRTARAFGVFNAKTGAVAGSVGIGRVTRNSEGNYTVVFSSEMPGTYAVIVGIDGDVSTHEPTVTSKTKTAFRIITFVDSRHIYLHRDLNEVQFVVFSTGE